MDIIKTIFRLSFFLLGCVMLMLALLVIPMGFTDFIWFFGFSVFFYILGYYYTLKVLKVVFRKIVKLFKHEKKFENKWMQIGNQKILYNLFTKELKLNTKIYKFEQIVSIDLMDNSSKVSSKKLLKNKTHKKLEIKIGTKINKITYRHYKYDDKDIKQMIKDYKILTKILKTKKK